MIQRKQSIFLLLAAILVFVIPFMPLATVAAEGAMDAVELTMCGAPVLLAVDILVGLLALICIFCFRNLCLQRRLANLTTVLTLVLLGSFILTVYTLNLLPNANHIVTVILILALNLSNLAAIYIKKDQRLLDSVNRLR